MRRWMAPGLALLLLLLAALAAVWWFLEDDGTPADGGAVGRAEASREAATADPRLRGARDAAVPGTPGDGERASAAEAASGHTKGPLHGVVVDGEGAPVPGAAVFVVEPKLRVVSVSADAEGAWTLGEYPLSEGRVGVLARGFLPLHHDLSEASGDAPHRLVLEAGPELVLRVQGADGGPLELDTDVWIRPTAEGARQWPGPGDVWAFAEDVTIPAGEQEARVRIGTTSEVEVSARYHHLWWNVEPDDPVLVPSGQTLTFTVVRSCQLDIRVFDAATGDPLPRGFSYTILGDGAPEGSGGMSRAGGRRRQNSGLRPGTYVLRVTATGYLARSSAPLTLTTPGEEATVEVHLERDPTRGNVRISVPALVELPPRPTDAGESQAAPAFFLWIRPPALANSWEREAAPTRTWGRLDGDSRRESDTDYVFEGVLEGEVGLVVGEVVSGRVALVLGIRIRGGRTDTTTVDLQQGIRFDPKIVIPEDGTCRSFRVRHPVHGELPTWSYRLDGSEWYEPGDVPSLDHAIGPYPGPEVEVEVVLEDGTTKAKVIR